MAKRANNICSSVAHESLPLFQITLPKDADTKSLGTAATSRLFTLIWATVRKTNPASTGADQTRQHLLPPSPALVLISSPQVLNSTPSLKSGLQNIMVVGSKALRGRPSRFDASLLFSDTQRTLWCRQKNLLCNFPRFSKIESGRVFPPDSLDKINQHYITPLLGSQ